MLGVAFALFLHFLVPFLEVHTAWLGCFCILLCVLLCFFSPFSFFFGCSCCVFAFQFLGVAFYLLFLLHYFPFWNAFSGWLFAFFFFFAFLKVGLHFPLRWFLYFICIVFAILLVRFLELAIRARDKLMKPEGCWLPGSQKLMTSSSWLPSRKFAQSS